jgi:hypothetical protein
MFKNLSFFYKTPVFELQLRNKLERLLCAEIKAVVYPSVASLSDQQI